MCLCVRNSEAHYSITDFSLKYAHGFLWIESSVHSIQSNLSGVSEVERSEMKECRVKGERERASIFIKHKALTLCLSDSLVMHA